MIEDLIDVKNVKDEYKNQFITYKLNDRKYWTIQMYAKNNRLYNDINLNKLFIENINNMFRHKVLENVFNQIKIFDNYKYPFLKESFIDQIHKSIIYIKLPSKLILGLTLKKVGIVIINKGRHDDIINSQKNKNTKFILKLAEYSFYKITLLHEISFHYILVILFSNKKIDFLDTPEKVFTDEIDLNTDKKLDFGDKGEVLLFGSNVSVLYISAVIDIITLDLWNKNKNTKPYKIGEKFIDLNKETTNDKMTLGNIVNSCDFVHCLYKICDNESDIGSFNLNLNVGNIFSRGKILNINPNDINLDSNDLGKILNRGICLNAGRYG